MSLQNMYVKRESLDYEVGDHNSGLIHSHAFRNNKE